jgi:Luciferase
VSHSQALVDEVANELETWPGVRLQRRSASLLVVSYDDVELGVLDRDRGTAELRFTYPERDEIVEHGEGLAATPAYDAEDVSHDVRGPSDVSAVLELFARRYRDVRGEDDPYASSDAS